ncbi:MAG: response regulator transcription factor [Acidobacteriia bacterium]|nr:response regulator transcription factor [Terriglobia bacterium]
MRPRLLLADDHTLMLEGIRLMLEPEFELVGSVEDGQSLLVAAKTLKPDIILLDISMPALNGIDAAHRLRKLLPSAKLIFLTMHADSDYVAAAFRAGAMGYLLKRAAASELKIAIREVMKGHHYVSPLVTRNALELLISSATPGGKPSDRLTPRQREVLQLVAEGRSRKEIASILNISIKTVEFHKSTLARELNLHTVADFTRYAIEHRIIPAERSS